MTTQPKRPTAEEAEVQELLEHIDECLRRGSEDFLSNREVATLAAALRKRDELADAYWRECEAWRKVDSEAMIAHVQKVTKVDDGEQMEIVRVALVAAINMAESTDATRRAAGLEDANA